MKLLFDFFPILLFFITYKFHGIYVATAVAIGASFLQVGFHWLKHRSVEKMHIITLILITVLGGATLFFHNELFIKWKPTAIYWVFAVILLGSQFFGEKPVIQRLMEANLQLPTPLWKKLNASWVVFFALLGSANLFVAYRFTTDVWVNFKLFGLLGLTLVFILAQSLYMVRAMNGAEITKEPNS